MNSFDNPKWGLLISPIDNLFQGFAEHARSPDYFIWRIEPGVVSVDHIWASAHFDDARDVYELADRATSLKAVFDGAMFMEHGALYDPPQFRSIIKVDSGRSYKLPPGDVLVPPFSQLTLSSAVPRRFSPMGHFGPSQMVFLARYDAVTRGMLKHLGFNGPDYRTLYSLLDWIKQHGWKKDAQIAAATGSNPSEINRFTHTVNNVEVLGPFARHGDKKENPPTRPMSLDDAQRLILGAAAAFIRERSVKCDLLSRWRYLNVYD